MLNHIFRYLRKPNRHICLQSPKAQFTASLSCVLYLQSSLDFVDPRVTEEAKRSSVLLCLHDLNLYAIDHWLDHLLELSESVGSCPDRSELEPLLRNLERLTEMHQSIAGLQGSGLPEEEEQDCRQQGQHWHLFGISHAARSLLNRVLVQQQTVLSEDHPPKEPHSVPAALQDSNSLILVSPAIDPNANDQYPLLFSHIRERYQSIVEELMETEEPNNQTLSAFILRQASGAFLCRHRGCPRAAQGFHSPEVREKHEESHRPRFQCAHATCGLFGTTFKSRAALKKHAARYHDDDNTASVPNSLTRKPRGLHEDRTLFAFSDTKTKRKAEGSRFHEEYSKSLQASFTGRTALASSNNRDSASDLTKGNSIPSTNASKGPVDRMISQLYFPGRKPTSEKRSPFREASQFSAEGPSDDFSGPITPATDALAYADYPPPSLSDHDPAETIVPREAYLGYENTEEDANYSQYRDIHSSYTPQISDPGFSNMALSTPAIPLQYPFISKSHRQSGGIRRGPDLVPEFPAPLTSMESMGSETDPPGKVKIIPEADLSLPSSREASFLRPTRTTATSGIFTCTAPECHARFDNIVECYKHSLEAHSRSF